MEKNPILQNDILRYKKNKLAGNLALLALVFNCLYFAMLYSISVNDIYKILLGGSVILNLLVLLTGFYASEGIKGYNKNFAYVLLGLAVVQIIRIFIYPLIGMKNGWLEGNYYFGSPMTVGANGALLIVYLVLSAACFVGSAVYGYIVALKLANFQKSLDDGSVSVEETLAQLDAAEVEQATEVNNG